MASHSRRSASPTASRTTARAALSLALVSAASVSLLGESAVAAPRPTPESVRAKVNDLYRQAEQATESYDGAKQKADTAGAAVSALQDELARKTAQLNSTRDALGTIAAAQYRSGSLDPTLQLVLSASPATYLEQAGTLDQLGDRQTSALIQLAEQRRGIEQTRAEANGKLATLRAAQAQLAAHKKTVESKLRQAQSLLTSLTPPQRAAVNASDGGSTSDAATRSTTRVPLNSEPAPSARAAQAVAFAYRALGSPYVWGATGPSSYDCSGLTQAAWRAAGVSLPRTTYTQINAGTRVPESELRPGDLVFFYSGVSHVGLYIGNGQMIHAPHPGASVQIAPISEMPFAGATRPA
jgi:cell wall-associated NlpC family hydrolase